MLVFCTETYAVGENVRVFQEKSPRFHVRPLFYAKSDRLLDLNTFLMDDPVSTYFYRVAGFSMEYLGMFPGDALGVSRAKQAVNGEIGRTLTKIPPGD